MPSEDEIEQLAVKHEAFGFGLADVKGYTTHGFDPDGLESFVREVLERWGAPQQRESVRVPLTEGRLCELYYSATGQHLRPQDTNLAFEFARAIERAHGITATEGAQQ